MLVEEADDEVRVRVLDRGIGLDEQPGADLFEPFYRGEPPVPPPAASASASRSAAGSCTCSAGDLGTSARRRRAEFGFALPIAQDVDDMPLRPF